MPAISLLTGFVVLVSWNYGLGYVLCNLSFLGRDSLRVVSRYTMRLVFGVTKRAHLGRVVCIKVAGLGHQVGNYFTSFTFADITQRAKLTMADDENQHKETETKTESKNKRRRRQRRRRQNKKQNEGENDKSNQPANVQGQNQSPDGQKKDGDKQEEKKKKRRRRRGKRKGGDDRYFGRFHCRICNRHWDSARVFTIGGTKIVKYRQRCKMCDDNDAWVFPYRLEILRCSQCGEQPCTCLCEDCGKLWHTRYIHVPPHRRDPEEELTKRDYDRIPDPQFEYCKCERRKNVEVGTRIDDKKPHLAKLCEKCMKGRPCVRATDSREREDSEDGNDNEP